MSLQDPISDMLTRIRNAQQATHVEVNMPSSNMKEAIAKVLKEEGFISDFSIGANDNKKTLTIILKYFNNMPVIAKINRVSRSGLRRYCNSKDLPRVMGGLGVAIISTSKGVMTNKTARKLNIGGEILCEVA